MKRAQFWYGDFLFAVLILIIIGFLFVYAMLDLSNKNNNFDVLIDEAVSISNILLCELFLIFKSGSSISNSSISNSSISSS